ncbi:hypothetical protein M2244_001034 [Rhodoferax antarcticus]|nr:hypothetical protein [Rhodoferax antarcticus]
MPTPVYDMLPMAWHPDVHGGELDTEPLQPQIQPTGYGALAAKVRAWACTYWERAADLPALSPALSGGARAMPMAKTAGTVTTQAPKIAYRCLL